MKRDTLRIEINIFEKVYVLYNKLSHLNYNIQSIKWLNYCKNTIYIACTLSNFIAEPPTMLAKLATSVDQTC